MNNHLIYPIETFDGANVKIYRTIGQDQNTRIDPFLMLDEFCSDKPDEYVGGFPSHPHRGFETFTYMIDGHLRHQDSMGNSGELSSGELQWMTAGRGIIHSEMPLQENGLMRGFQLWVNLPAHEKMQKPKYRDIKKDEFIDLTEGSTQIKLIAGKYKGHTGPISGLTTELEYFDINISKENFKFHGKANKNYFIYPFEGDLVVDGELVPKRTGMKFTKTVSILSRKNKARFLLIGGKPINESIAQYGPFVMNTKKEIIDAMSDYQKGYFKY